MRTFRAKLLTIVLVCVFPAFAAALLRARAAHLELIEEVTARLDSVDESFVSDLTDDLASQALALKLAASDPRLTNALSSGGPSEVGHVTGTLASVYPDADVLLTRMNGDVVAATRPSEAPTSLATRLFPSLAPLWQGDPFIGMVQVGSAEPTRCALVVAEPIFATGHQLGALAMIVPLDATYLAHEKLQLGSNWALRVNGKLVASNPGNPEPGLHVDAEKIQADGVVSFAEVGDRFFAFNTFKPRTLQGPGQLALMTASRDVTDMRSAIVRGLYRSLGILGGAMIVALVFALLVAGGMLDTVRRIGRAAASLKQGTYALVEGVQAKDELGALANTFNDMVAGLKERDQIKETFGKYVSRQVAEHVLRSKGLGGENVQVTVLFSDIRNFTGISEKMEPKAVLDFLNMYFSGMVEAVMMHHGVVDKFIGDAIMAVFGAPDPHPDDALRAVSSALEMRARLKQLNETLLAKGLPEIRAGIGVHTGTVVAGNMGHTDRREYTVIGDSVNLASRLETMTKELATDILLSDDTYQQVRDAVDAEPIRRITVKGRKQDVLVYRLLGLKGEAARAA